MLRLLLALLLIGQAALVWRVADVASGNMAVVVLISWASGLCAGAAAVLLWLTDEPETDITPRRRPF